MSEKWQEASFEPENARRAREVGELHIRSTRITNSQIADLLRDVFDVHTHSGPGTSIYRFYDDWEKPVSSWSGAWRGFR